MNATRPGDGICAAIHCLESQLGSSRLFRSCPIHDSELGPPSPLEHQQRDGELARQADDLALWSTAQTLHRFHEPDFRKPKSSFLRKLCSLFNFCAQGSVVSRFDTYDAPTEAQPESIASTNNEAAATLFAMAKLISWASPLFDLDVRLLGPPQRNLAWRARC